MLRITFFWGRHEKQSHPDLQATCTSSPETGHVINSAEEKKEDHVFNYHKAKLTYGLLFSDFGDAIREGDGQRLLSLYKLALLIFSCYGHTKYAYVTLLLLVRVHAILNQSEAFSLMSNRFCNTSGRIGRNNPLDLRLEHLNNLLKACVKALGANVNEESAQRIAAGLNGIEMILNSVDKD